MSPIRISTALTVALIVALLFCLRNTSAFPGEDDVTPPTLVSLTITPTTFVTLTETVTITATAHITDDWQGFRDFTIAYRNHDQTEGFGFTMNHFDRISGDAMDGIYQATYTVKPGTLSPGPIHAEGMGIRDIRYNTDYFYWGQSPYIHTQPLPVWLCHASCGFVWLPVISSQP